MVHRVRETPLFEESIIQMHILSLKFGKRSETFLRSYTDHNNSSHPELQGSVKRLIDPYCTQPLPEASPQKVSRVFGGIL